MESSYFYSWISENNLSLFQSYDSGIKIDYIFLIILLFFIAITTGKKLQNTKVDYWKNAMVFIIAFSIIEGLRYLRGTDYLNYALLYKYDVERSPTELIYLGVQYIFHLIDVPFWFPFVFYSFVWIVGLMYFLKDYRNYIAYILPVFVLLNLTCFENYIRQDFAWGFIFVFFSDLLNKRYKSSVLMALLAVLIHNSSIVFIVIILSIKLLKRPINTYITITLYLFAVFVYDNSNFNFLVSIIAKVPILEDSVLFGYIENAEKWFGSSAISAHYARSIITKIGVAFFDISIFILGYLWIKKYKCNRNENAVFFFNLISVTIVLFQFVFLMQIPKRVFSSFYAFTAFILAFIILDKRFYQKHKMWFHLIILYLFAYFIKMILLADNQLFVWDNVGKYNFDL